MSPKKFCFSDLIQIKKEQVASCTLNRFLDVETPVVLLAMDQGEEISQEKSQFVKLLLLLNGQLCIEIAKKSYVLSSNENLVIPVNTFHSIFSSKASTFLQIEFPIRKLEKR